MFRHSILSHILGTAELCDRAVVQDDVDMTADSGWCQSGLIFVLRVLPLLPLAIPTSKGH